METENYVMSLIDRLWFHEIILFPQPSLFHPTKDTKITVHSSEYSSKIDSQVISGQEISYIPKFTPLLNSPEEENSSQESDDLDEERERAKTESNPHSHSSLPQEKSRNLPRLMKSMSCKSLIELELEEVRGFIDLGFNFSRENLSNHMISLLPGLQRIDDFEEINEENKRVRRPYLSESWIIRKPDSPLLNLRMPRLCSAADMKKHLKFWAHTVASDVQQS